MGIENRYHTTDTYGTESNLIFWFPSVPKYTVLYRPLVVVKMKLNYPNAHTAHARTHTERYLENISDSDSENNAKARRSKVWLYFTQKDDNNSTCNKSNMMKHLVIHNIRLKAESCTVFDHFKSSSPLPSTSAGDVGIPDPGDETIDEESSSVSSG